jgi:hypothetical protein
VTLPATVPPVAITSCSVVRTVGFVMTMSRVTELSTNMASYVGTTWYDMKAGLRKIKFRT